MTKREQLMAEIIQRQDELISIIENFKQLSDPDRYFNRKHELKEEIMKLKSSLAEAMEEEDNIDIG